MTTEASRPAAKRHIHSAVELLAALRLPDLSSRAAILRAIAADPNRALAYGRHNGRDVIDELLDQAHGMQGRTEWLALVGVLAAFDDPRAAAFFRDVFATAEEPQVIFVAAERLSREPAGTLHDYLTPLLQQNDSVARARAAADLLADRPALGPAERVRVALLSSAEEAEAPPPLDEPTAPLWLAELDGPFRSEAREALEVQGESAFLRLQSRWESLSDENREWLLRWAARDGLQRADKALGEALASGTDGVALAALEWLALRGADAARFQPALDRLARHESPALRLAAIRAGAAGVDWRAALETESDPEIRQACAGRLARDEGPAALPDLIRLLENEGWAMRAAATAALISLGEPAAEAVKPLARHPDPGVRAAAVRALLALGQEGWVEREMLP